MEVNELRDSWPNHYLLQYSSFRTGKIRMHSQFIQQHIIADLSASAIEKQPGLNGVVNLISQSNCTGPVSSSTRVVFKVVWLLQGCLNLLYIALQRFRKPSIHLLDYSSLIPKPFYIEKIGEPGNEAKIILHRHVQSFVGCLSETRSIDE